MVKKKKKKKSRLQCGRHRKGRFDLWVRNILWRRKWQPIPVFLPAKLLFLKKMLFGPQIAKKKKSIITKTMSSVCLLVSMPDP